MTLSAVPSWIEAPMVVSSAMTHVFTMCIARLITGIDNHELNSLKLVDAGAKIMTNKGPARIFRRVRLSRR
jgi:hypothetical protein